MSIASSPSESDSSPSSTSSSSSSFASMTETSLSRDKMEQLIRKLRSENKQLQLRVLGVNELARLLQDRSEKVKVLEDKNKRLEVAVVRLENRCANLEQKLRSDGSGGPSSGLKSMQLPSIPGPSRQILEGLMKENSELKKTLNSMQKKGPSGYLEAVKTAQLEEVIEQQKQELEFLKNQVNMLTTTPLPSTTTTTSSTSTSSSSASTSTSSGGAAGQEGSDGSGGSSGPSGELRRQIIKMQHSLKVKDRFCSLLSDQVASLQERLRQMDIKEEPTGPAGGGNETAPKPSDDTPADPRDHSLVKQQMKELEARYEHVITEQKETLKKEREEHTKIVEKLQKAEQELKKLQREIAELDKRCEDLQFHNTTLLDDKKSLQESVDQMRGAGGRLNEGAGLERELRELQDSYQQKVMEHSEELKNKDKEMQQLRMLLEDTEYNYAIANSKLSEAEKELEQSKNNHKEELECLESDVSSQRSEIEELRVTNRQLEIDLGRSRSSKGSGARLPFRVEEPAPHLFLPQNMQSMVAVKDGVTGYTDKTVSRPQFTGQMTSERSPIIKQPHYLPPALLGRGAVNPEDDPPTSSSQSGGGGVVPGSSGSMHPSTLQFHNAPLRHPPSPSPSVATPLTIHPSSSGAPSAATGRRSPVVSPFSGQPPVMRPQHQYPPPPPQQQQPYHLMPQQMRHPHPGQQLPPGHYDPALQPYSPGAGMYGGHILRPPPTSGSAMPPQVAGGRPPPLQQPQQQRPSMEGGNQHPANQGYLHHSGRRN